LNLPSEYYDKVEFNNLEAMKLDYIEKEIWIHTFSAWIKEVRIFENIIGSYCNLNK